MGDDFHSVCSPVTCYSDCICPMVHVNANNSNDKCKLGRSDGRLFDVTTVGTCKEVIGGTDHHVDDKDKKRKANGNT